ncbi:hypothetical protein [Glycomyces tarimensis]
MTPNELHRAVITAVAFGDLERENRLRTRFTERDHTSAFEFLCATVIVCLSYRFGASERPDRAELGRFMAELRAAGPGLYPPTNFLEAEAVIRGLLGEPGMLGEVGRVRQRAAMRFVLRYLTDSEPEIKEDFDTVVDRAQQLQKRWLVGD